MEIEGGIIKKGLEFIGGVIQEIILSLEENRGYLCAILLVKVLPKEYIDKLNL
ncbi:MAG: hypothetical protein HFG36_08210 [Eubacterium sp.]|nr:hypothetical protein [Eubacterium sp.]